MQKHKVRWGILKRTRFPFLSFTYALLSLLKFFSIKNKNKKQQQHRHLRGCGFLSQPPTRCSLSLISVNTNSTHQVLRPKGLHQSPSSSHLYPVHQPVVTSLHPKYTWILTVVIATVAVLCPCLHRPVWVTLVALSPFLLPHLPECRLSTRSQPPPHQGSQVTSLF